VEAVAVEAVAVEAVAVEAVAAAVASVSSASASPGKPDTGAVSLIVILRTSDPLLAAGFCSRPRFPARRHKNLAAISALRQIDPAVEHRIHHARNAAPNKKKEAERRQTQGRNDKAMIDVKRK
jgi:hypothetical protein